MIEHSNLWVTSLTPEQHARTCDYWYTVTEGAMAHTAFNNENQLRRWLDARGLKLTALLPAKGMWGSQRIEGSYRETMHMHESQFYGLQGERLTVLSNGDYTLGIVTTDADGIKHVHSLNPNVRTRPVYDYAIARRNEIAA